MNNRQRQSPAPSKDRYHSQSRVTFTRGILTLARQSNLIIITPIITCTITIFYVIFFTTPVYESNARIMASSNNNNQSQMTGLAAQFGIDFSLGQAETQWVYPEIIKSRTLAKAMLSRKFNTNEFGEKKTLLQILTYGNQDPDLGFDTLVTIGIQTFLGMVDLEKSGNFYDLSISAGEPEFARDLTLALIEELDKHQRDYNKKKTGKARQFIEERIQDTKTTLELSEETLKDFRVANRRIENSPLLLLEQQRLLRDVTMLTGVYTTLKQQLETTKIEEVKESEYVIVLDPPEVPIKKAKPNRSMIVLLSGFLGIGLGFTIGVLREYIFNLNDADKKNLNESRAMIFNNLRALVERRPNK